MDLFLFDFLCNTLGASILKSKSSIYSGDLNLKPEF